MDKLRQLVVLGVLVVFAGISQAEDATLPQTSHDGLVLQKGTEARVVYMKPGADLGEYDKVALLEAYVAFKKNWQRDYNEEQPGLSSRVSDKDVARMRKKMAEEFNRVFTEVLSRDGHEMVSAGGDGVLVIRPAIVNLEVTAPDTMSPNMGQTASASAGQMTLYMELFDGTSGAIIYRIIDPQAAGNEVWQVRNSVTNKAAADRVLKRWATLLSQHLAKARS